MNNTHTQNLSGRRATGVMGITLSVLTVLISTVQFSAASVEIEAVVQSLPELNERFDSRVRNSSQVFDQVLNSCGNFQEIIVDGVTRLNDVKQDWYENPSEENRSTVMLTTAQVVGEVREAARQVADLPRTYAGIAQSLRSDFDQITEQVDDAVRTALRGFESASQAIDQAEFEAQRVADRLEASGLLADESSIPLETIAHLNEIRASIIEHQVNAQICEQVVAFGESMKEKIEVAAGNCSTVEVTVGMISNNGRTLDRVLHSVANAQVITIPYIDFDEQLRELERQHRRLMEFTPNVGSDTETLDQILNLIRATNSIGSASDGIEPDTRSTVEWIRDRTSGRL